MSYSATKKTESSELRWQIAVYAYGSYYPQQGESKEPAKAFDAPTIVNEGITEISFARSKGSVGDMCTISIFGPVPVEFFKGNWLIVSSLHTQDNKFKDGVPEFFGQIENLSVTYNMSGTGNIQQSSTITVRSWAFILRTPVKLDAYSLATIGRDDAVGVAKRVQEYTQATAKQVAELLSKSVNPFSFGGVALALIGALDLKGKTATEPYINFKEIKLPDVALTAPALPPGILQKILNLENSPNSTRAFSSGAIEYVAGVRVDSTASPELTIPTGFFPSTEEYKRFRDSYKIPTDRPMLTNYAPILLKGDSVFGMMQEMADPFANEFFADFYCIADGNKMLIQPFIALRDKPFALAKYKKQIDKGFKSAWSTYDDLPRIEILEHQITSFRIDDSFLDAPNFIRIMYSNNDMGIALENVRAAMESTFRDADAMSRYGGQSLYPTTSYIKTDGSYVESWYLDFGAMIYLWHALKYRLPDMTMNIRDLGTPLIVGMNVTFTIAGTTFVGHLEGFSKSYTINPATGKHQTAASLRIARLCVVEKVGGELDFIAPELIQDIFKQNTKPAAVNLTALNSSVSAVLDSITKVASTKIKQTKPNPRKPVL
jgi:hypothetical protein